MLLPLTCPVCGRAGSAPCPVCRLGLRRPAPHPAPPGSDHCLVLASYEGVGRELIARFKYRNGRAAGPWLATAMAALVPPDAVDVVTWVPTTWRRRRRRGYDQARLLAELVSVRLALPVVDVMRRAAGPPQTGRSAEERRSGPSFTARALPAGRVLLVDDVVTTGTTVTGAARSLRAAGAVQIVVLAAARTPRRTLPRRPSGR